jgi:dTDP-4-dehydrorhamnose reductase
VRLLVTGARGQLGTDLVALAAAEGHDVNGLDRAALDVTDASAVHDAVAAHRPDAVVHAAAHTRVDACETEVEAAYALNTTATWHVARACARAGAALVYLSTDYVFDGTLGRPYTEFDRVGPRSVYGRTKEAGEQKVRESLAEHYIVRTSWVHGVAGPNFATTMLRLGRERGALSVVDDQTGSPTFTPDLSRQILRLLDARMPGTYHVTGSGHCTWFELAGAIFERAGLDVRLTPTDTASFGAPAPRPPYSVLDNLMARQIGLPAMPAWEESLDRFLAGLG